MWATLTSEPPFSESSFRKKRRCFKLMTTLTLPLHRFKIFTIAPFYENVRESKNTTKIHTDNMPSVQAWKRLKTGAFSSSARVASFLTGLSTLRVELVHNPGKNNMVSDYNSRNPFTCSEPRCQIYKKRLSTNPYLQRETFTVFNSKGFFG